MKTIPLSRGLETIVDDHDYDWLMQWKWCAQTDRYPYAMRKGRKAEGDRYNKNILMHREIMQPGPGLQVDHINGNVLDNRRENLRECTPLQNRQHVTTSRSGSKYKGVRQDTFGNWNARIGTDHIGYYATEEEAAQAYNAHAKERYGEFAYLNDVGDVIPVRLTTERRSTSGHYGVSWDKARSKWSAQLRRGKKHVHLGRYDAFHDACRAVSEYLVREKQIDR